MLCYEKVIYAIINLVEISEVGFDLCVKFVIDTDRKCIRQTHFSVILNTTFHESRG